MSTFLFRCPVTKLNVQAFVADDPTRDPGEGYEAIKCTACTWTHWVNQKTGKVLGADNE